MNLARRRGFLLGCAALVGAGIMVAGALWPTASLVEGQNDPVHDSTATSSGRSRNWSGYAATSGVFTAVSGTWTVPNPSTGSVRSSDATWVGIGGVNHRDLIQAGTENTVLLDGTVRSQAWVETLPRPARPVALAVHPGDSVTVGISQSGSDQWNVSIADTTTGQSYQTVLTYASSLSSAEWVEEAPSTGRGVLPLDNFGTVRFTSSSTTRNGQAQSLAGAGAQPITMIDRFGRVVASPSAIGGDGSSFTVTRAQPAAPAVRPGPSIVIVPFPYPGFPFAPHGRLPSDPFPGRERSWRLDR